MKKIVPFILLFTIFFTSCGLLTDTKNKAPVQANLTSIYISQLPEKTNYAYEEVLDLTGLEVKARYSDGSEKIVDGWTSSPTPWTKMKSSGTIIITILYKGKTTNFTIIVAKKSSSPEITAANKYFWGIWVRMDSGTEYEVLESSVVQNNKSYNITSSDSSTLTVSNLGTFKKESDRVMVNNNIPYFRKGGTNLEYSLKIVNFNLSGNRAAATPVGGIKGKAKSTKYGIESESQSDDEGIIKFTAPTANDPQEITITDGDEVVVIPGLNIINSGDFMGTVALVGKDDYSLKITGKISDDQKDNGCLYGNGAKSYKMKVTITNITKNKFSTSVCTIEPKDTNLTIASDTTALSWFTISTLDENSTKTVDLSVEYGDLTDPFIDTGLNVIIRNPITNQEWTDFIPLRFFREAIPITIAAKNPENNKNAALNGFIIYPDGNNLFFSIKNDSNKTILVPTFGSDKKYMLVFSGATVTSQLSNSTEMYYTVNPGTLTPRPVITQGDESILTYIPFGGKNHTEKTAYSVISDFEAYLSDGEIDYYSIAADL